LHFSPKLLHKGMFLVAVPLIFQGIFVYILLSQLNQAENEVAEESRAKRLEQCVSHLGHVCYQAGFSLAGFATSDSQEQKKKYLEAAALIPELRQDIRHLIEGRRDEQSLFEPVERDLDKTEGKFKRINELIKSGDRVELLFELQHLGDEFEPLMEEFAGHLQAFSASAIAIEKESPERQRQSRERMKYIVFVGLMSSMIFVFGLAIFLFNGILKRLNVMRQNITRLPQDLELLPLVKGNDEIAELDDHFHYMVDLQAKAKAQERLMMEEIRQNEERVRSIIENLPDGLCCLSEDGTIEIANDVIQVQFGCGHADMIGEHASKLFDANSKPAPDEILSKLTGTDPAGRLEVQCRRFDGSTFPSEISLSTYPYSQSRKYILSIQDVTERHALQRMKQEFYAMITHDLRSPLMAVQGHLCLLSQNCYGELPDKAIKISNTSHSIVLRLGSLINDLLDVEKLESGKFEIIPEMASISYVVKRALESVSYLANAKRLTICLPESDVEMNIDRERMVQVLINLLSNAIKFAHEGSNIEVELHDDGNFVEIGVCDHGEGIPAEAVPSLFERFTQAKTKSAKGHKGTGLGLAICKMIVEAHAGTIGVSSEYGKGSRFWFRLPKQESAIPAQR
jgi:PAS domain S-box-containing protein